MRSKERQTQILKAAQKNGFVSIPQMAQKMDVSIETIRRDINRLCKKNQLKKVHGGAVPVKTPIVKSAEFSKNLQHNHPIKDILGKTAAQMVHDGDVVAMDSSSTTLSVANWIHGVRDVSFVVNSIPIALLLKEKIVAGEISGKVIMIGGETSLRHRSTTGPLATDAIDRYSFDLAFLSCTSLSADGASNTDIGGSIYVKHMMDRSAISVLVADSDKLGKSSVYTFAKLTDFDRIIIDDQFSCPADIKALLDSSDTELTIVDCRKV